MSVEYVNVEGVEGTKDFVLNIVTGQDIVRLFGLGSCGRTETATDENEDCVACDGSNRDCDCDWY